MKSNVQRASRHVCASYQHGGQSIEIATNIILGLPLDLSSFDLLRGFLNGAI